MIYYQNLWCVPCILVVSQVSIAWTQSSLAVGRPSPRLDMPHATGVGLIDIVYLCVSVPSWLHDGRRSMAGWVREPYLVRMSLPVFVMRNKYSFP